MNAADEFYLIWIAIEVKERQLSEPMSAGEPMPRPVKDFLYEVDDSLATENS